MEQAPDPSPAPPRPPRQWRLYGVAVAVLLAEAAIMLRSQLGWPSSWYWMIGRWTGGGLGAPWRGGWRFPTEAAVGLLAGLAVLAINFGLGYAMLAFRPWRRALPLVSERAFLAPLAGAVPLSLAVLGLGLAGGCSPAPMALLTLAALAPALAGWLRLARDLRGRAELQASYILSVQPRALLAMLIAIGTIAILYALSPATESDELRYHLAAPATWLRDGRIHYIPFQAFSNFPFLTEMLFLQAMALGNPEAAKLVHLGFLPVCAGLVGLLAMRLARWNRAASDPIAPFVSGACFAFIPVAAVLAAWGFIDIAMTAFFLGFVYLAASLLTQPVRASASLLGLMAAGAMSVKYSMIPLLVLLSIPLFVLAARSQGPRRALAWALKAGTVAAAGCSPWLIKNLFATGNPFYPLAWGIFGGGEWSAECARIWASAAAQKGMHLGNGFLWKAAEWLISPYTTAFDFFNFEDHDLGPLPLMALILTAGWLVARAGRGALCKGLRRRDGRAAARLWFGIALAGSWVFWLLTYQSNRLLLPTCALALAAGGAAYPLWRRQGPAWLAPLGRLAVGLTMLHLFVLHMTWMLVPVPGGAGRVDAIAVATGFERRDIYLDRRLDYWQSARALSQMARPGAWALLAGQDKTMYFDLPVVASDWFDTPQPVPWIRATEDNDQLLDMLRSHGIEYIFFNEGHFRRYWNQYAQRMSPEEMIRVEALWYHPRLKLIHERLVGDEKAPAGLFRIYEILPTMPKEATPSPDEPAIKIITSLRSQP